MKDILDVIAERCIAHLNNSNAEHNDINQTLPDPVVANL
jgi:hypothetical protein